MRETANNQKGKLMAIVYDRDLKLFYAVFNPEITDNGVRGKYYVINMNPRIVSNGNGFFPFENCDLILYRNKHVSPQE